MKAEKKLPLKEALEKIQDECADIILSEDTLRFGIQSGDLKDYRYSLRPKARIFLKMSEVRQYVKKIKARS